MNKLPLEKGFYQILNISLQKTGNITEPIADGYFKKERGAKFSQQKIKVSVGSLYNKSSIGPKDMDKSNLKNNIVQIKDLIHEPSSATQAERYIVVWDVINTKDYGKIEKEDTANTNEWLLADQEALEIEFSSCAYELDIVEIENSIAKINLRLNK